MSNPASAVAHPAATQPLDARAPRRVRHDPRRRCSPSSKSRPLPRTWFVSRLTGDLDGFISLGFDDHVKLFFPDGTTNAEGAPSTLGRDFTPRRHDARNNTLEIDFAIHDAGPATRWAAQAKPGDTLALGGPRGSFIIPTTYDWHLLIGDETALPAVSRRLAELPAGTRAVVVVEVDGPDDAIALPTADERNRDLGLSQRRRGRRQ